MSSEQESEPHNRINSFVTKHPIGEAHADRLRAKLHENMCKYLHPFKQYYSEYPVEYLIAPRPTYIQKQAFQYRPRLSYSKQMEYLRGSTKHHVEQEHLRELLDEDAADRGLMSNQRGTSLMVGGMLIYADDATLLSVRVNTEAGDSSLQNSRKQMRHELDDSIMELREYGDTNHVIVRCRYRVYLFNLNNDTLPQCKTLPEEVTACHPCQSQPSIMISTYDQQQYRLYKWEIDNHQLTLVRTCSSFWGVHSLLYLNRREFMFGFANKIIIDDLRTNGRETVRRITQIGNDRFCSLLQIQHQRNQFVLSKSQFINVFDIRKPEQDLLSIRHYCQEAPPTCLINLHWEQPMLIAYSPSQLGSSLLVNLATTNQSSTNPMNSISTKGSARPILLYDSGKYYKGLHPYSVSYLIIDDVLYVFHIDSSNGVSLEVLRKQNKNDLIHLKPKNFVRYPENPCLKWVQQKQLELYLREKTPESDSSEEQQSSSQQQVVQSTIFKKYSNYCSLQKFKNRINELTNIESTIEFKHGQKQGLEAETYMTSIQQLSTQSDNDWNEIIKYAARNSDPEHKISDKLLDFMEKDWKI